MGWTGLMAESNPTKKERKEIKSVTKPGLFLTKLYALYNKFGFIDSDAFFEVIVVVSPVFLFLCGE